MIRVAIYLLLVLVAAKTSAQEVPSKQLQIIHEIAAVQVFDNVYVIHGLSGLPTPENRGLIANVGLIVSDKGVIVIDSGSSDQHGKRILDQLAKITQMDVVAVFNTHIHGDHWLGNNAIAQRYPAASFYAHGNLIALAKEGAGDDWINLFNRLTDGAVGETKVHVPNVPVAGGQRIDFGNVTIGVLHHRQAHTTTDIILSVEQKNQKSVVFLGDTAVYQRTGLMDDGGFAGNIEILQEAVSLDARVYVPGHGPSTEGPLSAQSYLDYLTLLYQKTEALYQQGLADFEIKDEIQPAFERWRSWQGFDETFGRHVSLVYLEIEEASF